MDLPGTEHDFLAAGVVCSLTSITSMYTRIYHIRVCNSQLAKDDVRSRSRLVVKSLSEVGEHTTISLAPH